MHVTKDGNTSFSSTICQRFWPFVNIIMLAHKGKLNQSKKHGCSILGAVVELAGGKLCVEMVVHVDICLVGKTSNGKY